MKVTHLKSKNSIIYHQSINFTIICRISIRTGINHNNLVELRSFEIHEPAGWVIVPTRDARSNPIKTWMIQIAVLANHQSGRDTHIRQIVVHSPTETSSIFIDPKFSSIELASHSSCR